MSGSFSRCYTLRVREAEAIIHNALSTAADGMRLAEEHARFNRHSNPALELAAAITAEASAPQQQQDALRDIVELSESSLALRANSAVFRTAGAVSQEVINLGRRLDVRC